MQSATLIPAGREGGVCLPLTPEQLAHLAVTALRDEAELTPTPGLVDRRGGGAHTDMDVPLLRRSADSLEPALVACARLASTMPSGVALRAAIGAAGRIGEQHMLEATGGVNTHRGALWALGLLAAGFAARTDLDGAVGFAARLAAVPDPVTVPDRPISHGEHARRRHGVTGARGEAIAGFPHVVRHCLPALRRSRAAGHRETDARIDALLTSMAVLDDTCLLYRGGWVAVRAVQEGARAVLAAGGSATPNGRVLLDRLDTLARDRQWSTGGSGDVLAATLFVDRVLGRTGGDPCAR